MTKWEDLLDELTPRQLTVLEAFSRLEPWGDRRADLREAAMAATITEAILPGAEIDINKLAEYLADPISITPQEQFVSPNAAAATMAAAFPSKVKR